MFEALYLNLSRYQLRKNDSSWENSKIKNYVLNYEFAHDKTPIILNYINIYDWGMILVTK